MNANTNESTSGAPTRPNLGRSPSWNLMGVTLLTLAVGLAAVGCVLAFQQAQAVTTRLVGQVQLRARQINAAASSQIQVQSSAALWDVGRLLCLRRDVLVDGEIRWEWLPALPTWFDGLYTWDGRSFRVLRGPRTPREGAAESARTRLARLTPPSPDAQTWQATELLDSVGLPPMIAMQVRCVDGGSELQSIAAVISVQGLRDEVLEPLIAQDDGLELVAADQATNSPSFPLSGLMKSWAVQPTAAFLAEQRAVVVGQTMTYIALTLIALLTLVGAAWFFVRVARREMALAELKSNFVADVSHELKTPLALIRLFAETLQTGRVNDDKKRQEYYDVIARESTRLTNLINNILDFARIEAGRRAYNLQTADVGSVLRETYDSYRTELDRHGFEHHLQIAPGLPRVRIDRDAIAQILVNLMNNAVKYSSDERYLLIDVARDTRRGRRGLLISVEDHGIGIRPEDRARIFEGFFRAADGRVQSQGGTGLGLSLVKHTIEAHGGTMDVESRLVKGTAFRLFLPAAETDGAMQDGVHAARPDVDATKRA